EDGIRDLIVTGVQTCALPISAGTNVARGRSNPIPSGNNQRRAKGRRDLASTPAPVAPTSAPRRTAGRTRESARPARRPTSLPRRSEERRVGKECRSAWGGERG